VLATSLQVEDQVLTHLIAEQALPIGLIALDTGRLPAETLDLIARTEARYGVEILRIRPDPARIAALIARSGENAIYDSTEARKACCHVRKVEPLARVLAGCDGWITGQRREQDDGRAALAVVENDAAHGIAKFNPLADWTLGEVWAAARHLGAPLSAFYQRGYASIGCDPCTRAVRADEPIRAGRWWWESGVRKECGLHGAPERAAG
jgi:phosphoadenosine phosphosulfate reductase